MYLGLLFGEVCLKGNKGVWVEVYAGKNLLNLKMASD